jgi:hypothetical protein
MFLEVNVVSYKQALIYFIKQYVYVCVIVIIVYKVLRVKKLRRISPNMQPNMQYD